MGGESADSGEWTEVVYRRRKALREVDGGHVRSKQNLRVQEKLRSLSSPGNHPFDGDQPATNNHARDHASPVRFQSRCNNEHHRNRRRSTSLQRRRSSSALSIHDSTLFRGQREGRWQSKDVRRRRGNSNRSRRQDDYKQRQRSKDSCYRHVNVPRRQKQIDVSSHRSFDTRLNKQGNTIVGGFVGGEGEDQHDIGKKAMLGTDLRRPQVITGVTNIGLRRGKMRWKAEIRSYNFHVQAKTQFGAKVCQIIEFMFQT